MCGTAKLNLNLFIMKLLYSDEHFACYNYSWKNSTVEIVDINNEVFKFETPSNCIVAVYKGDILYSSGMITEREIKAGEIFVVPFQNVNIIKAIGECRIFIFKLNIDVSFCDHFSFEKLYDYLQEEDMKESVHPLKANEVLMNYIKALEGYISDGLRCVYFLEIKMKELLFILRAYYKKRDLARLFYPIINKDMEFSRQVFRNLPKAKTVKDLAELMYYSVSGFEKRFKRVFGMSANKWMQQNVSREIYREINTSNKTMSEIAYQFGFSPSHFNDYCKRVFKKTPTQLREKKEAAE